MNADLLHLWIKDWNFGALTHGDRRYTETHNCPNSTSTEVWTTSIGRLALTNVIRAIIGTKGPKIPPKENLEQYWGKRPFVNGKSSFPPDTNISEEGSSKYLPPFTN